VEIDVKDRGPTLEVTTNQGIEDMGINLKDMLPNLFGQKTRKRKMRVAEALDYLVQEEEQKLIDMEQVTRAALERVESSGIIFLDEIDKIAGRESGHGPDVSREGVQRDILPIVEGTTVNTRHGFVRTDHILFIAAGAFHVSKPSDLIPELQGRFPIRVELKSLTVEDFIRILKEPKNALAKQYTALLETEGIKLILTDDALEEVARFAAQVNEASENIGARRLHTIMEKMLEEVSFAGPDLKKKTVRVDAAYVRKQLADIVKDQDLSRYILFHAKVTAAEKPGPVEASATLPDELLAHQNVTVVVGARVINTKGRPSAWSNLVTIHVVKPVAAPSDMIAAAAPEGVRVTWTDSAEHSFRVFRKGPDDKGPVEIGKSDTTYYIDQTIVWGSVYQYWVQALRDSAESEVVAYHTITPIDTFAPAVPAELSAVTGINSIELAWERNTETDLKTYIIYRATGAGPFQKLAETDVPVYSDKAIEAGKRYRYAISAIDIRANESAKSVPVEAAAP
jgi:hypothetical protein